MIRSIASSARCALVAMLAIAMVAARPVMMSSHALPGAAHGCGMEMPSQHSQHSDHGCPTTAQDACCDDCMCACAIGSDVRKPVVVLVATYTRVATVIEEPAEVVRSHQQPALRLPPPLGPPHLTRS
ncbi:MAG: hypothetical protein ACM34L_13605 [Gemmatimonas sp.]|nr:hypothetical protein [Gemmatimonadaceae bacterium]